MSTQSAEEKPRPKHAPTYVGIILFKLVKGSLLLGLAFVAYCLSDNNLPDDYRHLIEKMQPLLEMLRVHPGNEFFTHIGEALGRLTESKVLFAAAGTLLYSLFSLVEGVGLIFHISWAGWMAIGESAFFIPIEIFEITRRSQVSWWLIAILAVNIVIVCYLFRNRERLFHHRHKPNPVTAPAPTDPQK